MRNTKEIQAILTSIFCLNQTGARDNDITLILDYAFRRIYGSNTNLLAVCCVGQTRETIFKQIMELLEQETQYKQYLEEYKK